MPWNCQYLVKAREACTRRFPIKERYKGIFAVEAFNLLNHSNYYSYTTNANSTSYGKPSAAAAFFEYKK